MTLLEEANFKSLSELEKFNLNYKGLYALRVIDITRLPKIFQAELLNCKHSIIYIGKAEITLNKRLRAKHMRKGSAALSTSLVVPIKLRYLAQIIMMGVSNKLKTKLLKSLTRMCINLF